MNQPMNRQLSLTEQQAVERSFITRTFLWMTLGLLITGVVAFVVANSPAMLEFAFGNPWITIGLLLTQLIVVIVLVAAIERLDPTVATLIFLGYAALTGVTFSTIFSVYTETSIFSTFVVTAGMFGLLTIFGMSTKIDLTAIGTLAIIGLIGVILMSVVNIFLQSPALYWIISIAGVLIFVALIARDAQRLKQMATQLDPNTDQGARASVIGALQLYLDFINLFLFLLRILGRRD